MPNNRNFIHWSLVCHDLSHKVHRKFKGRYDAVTYLACRSVHNNHMKIKALMRALINLLFGQEAPDFVEPIEPQYISIRARRVEDSRFLNTSF